MGINCDLIMTGGESLAECGERIFAKLLTTASGEAS
jgi:altronate dehydratase